jgi:hypothetical protein
MNFIEQGSRSRSTLSSSPLFQNLARANDFSPEDVRQNHEGLLSTHQQNRLLRWGGYHGLMFLIGNALLAAPFFDGQRAMSTGSLLLLLSVELIFVFSFGWSAASIAADLWRAKVNSVEGIVWSHSHRIRGGRSYFYIMDSHRFQVTKAAYAALAAGHFYRIFYASHSKRLVSIEPLEVGKVV